MDGETSSMDESIICGCHPWMEKGHPWMSSMDRDMSSMDESVMGGYHPQMETTDDEHGWSIKLSYKLSKNP